MSDLMAWNAGNTRMPAKVHYQYLFRLFLLLGLTLVLASCAWLTPSYEVPALPVAARYPADAEPGTDGVVAVQTDWRDYFPDLRLQALIAQALANNRDLRAATLRVAEARSLYGIQRADRFPSVNAQADLYRSRTPADLSVTGAPLVASQYQVALGAASWEIDFWGRVRNLTDAALESYLATDEGRRAATIGLVAQVANSYLVLRELDERIRLARQTIATRQESFRIFSRRVAVGSTSRLDLTQVETLLTQAQTLVVQLELARALQAHALTLLVGAPVDLPPLQDRFDDQGLVREVRAGLPSDLIADRPDIIAAEHQLKAANANIGAARAAFFPRVTLTAAFGTASTQLENLFEPGSGAWNFAPSISLPIFNAGRLSNNLSLSETRRDLAVANYESVVQNAFRNVSDALSSRKWLAEQVGIQRRALVAQTERARLATLRYDSGAARYLEVLDAQRDLLDAEQQLVQTRRALLSSSVNLYAALGGGWQLGTPFSDKTDKTNKTN